MVNFATNRTKSSSDLFKKRSEYQTMYPIDPSSPNPIDFRMDAYRNYGKLNNRNDFVFPDSDHLKQVGNSNVWALNFVADAYFDFEKYMKIDSANRMLADNFISQNWSAARAWEGVNGKYQESMNSHYNAFVGPYLDNRLRHKNIKSFDTFLDLFMNGYLNDLISIAPITKTGLISSRYTGHNSSGLCIELSVSDHGDDNEKVDKFLSSPNFSFYTLAASKFGFLVDKNAPWRLVANLQSPVMHEYARRYIKEPIFQAQTKRGGQFSTYTTVGENLPTTNNVNAGKIVEHWHDYEVDENGNGQTTSLYWPDQGQMGQPIANHRHEIINWVIQPRSTSGGPGFLPTIKVEKIETHDHLLRFKPYDNITTDDLFASYYIPSHIFDIENLKVYLFSFYNTYVSTYPVVAVPSYCKTSAPSGYFKAMQIRDHFRDIIEESQFNNKYGDLFWLRAYFLIRLREIGVNLSSAKKISNLNKIGQIYNSLDFMAAMSYIQIYLKQYY